MKFPVPQFLISKLCGEAYGSGYLVASVKDVNVLRTTPGPDLCGHPLLFKIEFLIQTFYSCLTNLEFSFKK